MAQYGDALSLLGRGGAGILPVEERQKKRNEYSREFAKDVAIEAGAALVGAALPGVGTALTQIGKQGLRQGIKAGANKGLRYGATDAVAQAGGFGAQQYAKEKEGGIGTQILSGLGGAGGAAGAYGLGKKAIGAAGGTALSKASKNLAQEQALQGLSDPARLAKATAQAEKAIEAAPTKSIFKLISKATGVEDKAMLEKIAKSKPLKGEILPTTISRETGNAAAVRRSRELAQGGTPLQREINKEGENVLETLGLQAREIEPQAGSNIIEQMAMDLKARNAEVAKQTSPLYQKAFEGIEKNPDALMGALQPKGLVEREVAMLQPHIKDIEEVYKKYGHEGLFAHLNSKGAMSQKIKDMYAQGKGREAFLLRETQNKAMEELKKQAPLLPEAQAAYAAAKDAEVFATGGQILRDYMKNSMTPEGLRPKKAPEGLIKSFLSGSEADAKQLYKVADIEGKAVLEQSIINKFAEAGKSEKGRAEAIKKMHAINPEKATELEKAHAQFKVHKRNEEELRNVKSGQRIGTQIADAAIKTGTKLAGIIGVPGASIPRGMWRATKKAFENFNNTEALQAHLLTNPEFTKRLAQNALKGAQQKSLPKNSIHAKKSILPAIQAIGRPMAQKQKPKEK